MLSNASNFSRCFVSSRSFGFSTFASQAIVGKSVSVDRCFSREDVEQYGQLTGDTNPVHFDHEVAGKLNFAKPIVHGALINGIVSRVIGTMLPGPGSVLLEQTLRFPSPLFVGDKFTTTVTINNHRHNIYTCLYECIASSGKKVLVGEARILNKSATTTNVTRENEL